MIFQNMKTEPVTHILTRFSVFCFWLTTLKSKQLQCMDTICAMIPEKGGMSHQDNMSGTCIPICLS